MSSNYQALEGEPCGLCHQPLSFLSARFGCACRTGTRNLRNVGVRIKRSLHGSSGTGHDYRQDLARFPNDPEAYVDGPRSLQKLVDLRQKRDGWIPRDAPTVSQPEDITEREHDELFQKCLKTAIRDTTT